MFGRGGYETSVVLLVTCGVGANVFGNASALCKKTVKNAPSHATCLLFKKDKF